MKRIGALICLMIITMAMLAPASFAAGESDTASEKAGFTIKSSTPEDGAKGVSVENLSVKIYFSKEMLPESKDVRKANAKEFKLTDKNGDAIPIKVYYSHKEEGLMMIVSDVIDSDVTIAGNTKYKLTIGDGLQSTDGTRLGTKETIEFKTLDQSKSTTVYTIMMVVMIVGMIFFTSRSAKKAAEKENEQKNKKETVNPYKEAKRTGKSVEEIVEKDQKKKAKQAEALAKQKAKEAELDAEFEAKEAKKAAKRKAASTKKVSAPRPISEAGSQYKIKVIKAQEQKGKKSATNPKNQTGKQKNSKNKKK
ncbi:Ig-like domain-containing protein [Mogibacterium sp. NSJ-24]|jgi:vacuolar-type H+-ATPase subunit I/STV1|uniref:Ig-like domain-containing protein n=1 Tax=Lentihominibacter hominis TaxID=2763645 RepID=A0A926I996_9FIRM|nr:Ig-like domain-containing protein [Lentihominibacter hominis]MBC8567797.1 Ig-like domain-containing protein [Lentihominibacter hominis]